MKKVLFVDINEIEGVAYTEGSEVTNKLENQRFVYTTDIKCVNKDNLSNYNVILRNKNLDTIVMNINEENMNKVESCETIEDIVNLVVASCEDGFKPNSREAYVNAVSEAIEDLRNENSDKLPSKEIREKLQSLSFMLLYNTDLQNVFK